MKNLKPVPVVIHFSSNWFLLHLKFPPCMIIRLDTIIRLFKILRPILLFATVPLLKTWHVHEFVLIQAGTIHNIRCKLCTVNEWNFCWLFLCMDAAQCKWHKRVSQHRLNNEGVGFLKILNDVGSGHVVESVHEGDCTTQWCYISQMSSCSFNGFHLNVTEDEEESDWAAMTVEEEWKEQHDKNKLDKRRPKLSDVYAVTGADDGTVGIWRPLVVRHLSCY